MDRARVAAFYSAKGYAVQEAVLATGQSGTGHRVPLLCEGPLGNLAIFFGDAGGVDEHEMSAARRVAKDLGATAILAANSFTNGQRSQASDYGVVLLDADAISPEAAPPVPMERRPWPETIASTLSKDDVFADHPWPNSGRRGGRDGAAPTTFEIDDLLRDLDKPLRSAATPPLRSDPVRDAPSNPSSGTSASSTESLWRHPRKSDAYVTPRPVLVQTRSTDEPGTRFAWLGLPAQQATPSTPLEVELEHSGVLRSRQIEIPPAEELTARPHDATYAALRRRVWIRRTAWMAGSATLTYLFLLWWL